MRNNLIWLLQFWLGHPQATRLLAQSLILCNQRLVSVSHTIFKLVSVSYEVLSSYVCLGV